jgi:sulfate/thiosulfate transport system ATP-binding protein
MPTRSPQRAAEVNSMNAMGAIATETAISVGKPVGVTVENVVKTFQDTPALHGVSLDVGAGELLALLGPSGSGKTTLLRILAGLDEPTAGRVLFGGEDAIGFDMRQRNVGFVFQSYALFRHMRVFDNIAFGLKVRPGASRPSAGEIRRRVLHLLDLVQLSGLENRYPGQLSGGQRQRVALARALAIEPRVLLLDEPFGALDAKVRRELRRWLREIHDRTGHTTVFVTHDQEEAMELADRVVVLNQGRIEQVGTADEVYDAPASPFVFSFIGESSALPVEIAGGRVVLADRDIDLGAASAPDGPAMLHFRPHDTTIGRPGEKAIEGIVTAVRRHGAMRRLELAIAGDSLRVEIDAQPDFYVQPAGSIAFMPTKWQLYPAD